MYLKVIGVNHKTAPIEVREKFSITKEAVQNGLENIHHYEGLHEAVILSTCNRTEVYTVTDSINDITKRFIFDLVDNYDEIDEYFYSFNGAECIRHLFRVASSLDSLILGEGQILSQVKAAYATSKEYNATGTIFNTLFNRAIATGKAVRTDTKIAYNSVSVSYAAVELAKKELETLRGKKALIFGAGKMAQLTVQHLISNGIDKIYVANHHIERAEELAEKIGVECEAVEWSKALEIAVNVDVIVTSTGAPHYVVKSAQTKELMQRRNNRKLFIIDIAVPRDVEPEVGEIEGVTLYNVDDLEAVVDEHISQRREEAKLAKKIVDENVETLVERFKYLSFQPLMASLSEHAEQVRLRELHRATSKLPNLTSEEQRVIDNMTKMIVRKLLREPMMNLNSSAGTPEEKFYTAAMRSLFSSRV